MLFLQVSDPLNLKHILLTIEYEPYLHTDPGVEIRRVFQKLRSLVIENFNEHFKGILFTSHYRSQNRNSIEVTRRRPLWAELYGIQLDNTFTIRSGFVGSFVFK